MKKNSKLSGVIALALLITASITLSPAANAADKGWRYWGYYQAAPGAKTWTAALTGPTVDIKDGAVEGWSFVFSSYAPNGEKIQKSFTTCVRTEKTSQGIDVLGMAVKIRAAKSGLICGLNGYPKRECGVEISTPAALKK